MVVVEMDGDPARLGWMGEESLAVMESGVAR